MKDETIEQAIAHFDEHEVVECQKVTQRQILEALTPQEIQILAALPAGLPMRIMDYLKIPRE